MSASSRLSWLRQVGPLAPAAFAVHQLRYLLAYGNTAGAQLERSGHSYLHSVVPWLVGVLALVVGGFLRSLGRAFAGQRSPSRYSLSLLALWLACSMALVGIFVCQELLEGFFATGHPAGLAGVFGFGGWWAAPAALCVGLVLAAWLHGARWVLREVARRRALGTPAPAPTRATASWPRTAPVLIAPAPIIDGTSQRGPPVRRVCAN